MKLFYLYPMYNFQEVGGILNSYCNMLINCFNLRKYYYIETDYMKLRLKNIV